MLTVSIIKADVGGFVRHSTMHPEVMAPGNESLAKAKQAGTLGNVHVSSCGDDMLLIMTHARGVSDEDEYAGLPGPPKLCCAGQ